MRVLMLGWEFPPVISGGLGTACHGLTSALAQAGAELTFFVPRGQPAQTPSHLRLVDVEDQNHQPQAPGPAQTPTSQLQPTAPQPTSKQSPAEAHARQPQPAAPPSTGPDPNSASPLSPYSTTSVPKIEIVEIDAMLRPYARPERRVHSLGPFGAPLSETSDDPDTAATAGGHGFPSSRDRRASRGNGHKTAGGFTATAASALPTDPGDNLGQDIFEQVNRFAHLATLAAVGQNFDVVHAHDWMTFPAGVGIAAMSGAPLVVHVHSTEFDRAGPNIDQRIYDIERMGMERASAVIAVSHLTRTIIVSRYGISADMVSVVYNAINTDGPGQDQRPAPRAIRRDEKIVLFLGRITMQKGPEYFLAAARKVLQIYGDVRFIMAGSGDMIERTMQLAAAMGISDRVLFTGFLEGPDVERVFRSADLYVMPSVSEPFGIASLEAIGYDVPVLISKQSGASEVLRHVLKVDFWDIDEMANKIVAVLRHPPLHATLKAQAGFEVRHLTWADAAKRCLEIYQTVVNA